MELFDSCTQHLSSEQLGEIGQVLLFWGIILCSIVFVNDIDGTHSEDCIKGIEEDK